MDLILRIICLVVCSVMMVIAAIIDKKKMRIPNWITFPSIFLGLALNFVISWQEGLISLGIIIVLFFIGAIGFLGMGDLKLMMAVVALKGWLCAIVVLGVASILLAVHKVKIEKYQLNFKRLIKPNETDGGLRVPFAPYMLLGYVFYFFTYVITPQGFII